MPLACMMSVRLGKYMKIGQIFESERKGDREREKERKERELGWFKMRWNIHKAMSLVCFRLTGGTTWHAAGLITQARDDLPTSKLMQYSRKLYEDLEADGQNLCMLSKWMTILLYKCIRQFLCKWYFWILFRICRIMLKVFWGWARVQATLFVTFDSGVKVSYIKSYKCTGMF